MGAIVEFLSSILMVIVLLIAIGSLFVVATIPIVKWHERRNTHADSSDAP